MTGKPPGCGLVRRILAAQFATSAALKLVKRVVDDILDTARNFAGRGRSKDVFNLAAEFVRAKTEIAFAH
jgi:hypothetical protein